MKAAKPQQSKNSEVKKAWDFVSEELGTNADSLMYPVIWTLLEVLRALKGFHRFTGRVNWAQCVLRGLANYLDHLQVAAIEKGTDPKLILDQRPGHLRDYTPRVDHFIYFKDAIGPLIQSMKVTARMTLGLRQLSPKEE